MARPLAAPRRWSAYLELLHPLPVLLTVLAGAGFAWIAAGETVPPERLGLFLGALLLTQCAISAHNDYCDRELDAAAKPWRPIPSGAVSPAMALGAALVLLVAGLALLLPLGGLALALGALGTGAGLAYSAVFKRGPLSFVPFLVGFPTLVLWAFAAMERFAPALLAVYAVGAPLVVAVHLADALPDVDSDGALGAGGLAQRLGRRAARVLAWGCLLIGATVVALLGAPAVAAAGPIGVLVAAAAAAGRRERLHWLAVMASSIALGLGGVGALALASG